MVAELDTVAADGVDWAAVRADYETDLDNTIETIAVRHGTMRSAMQWRAERDGWKRRKSKRAVGRPLIIVRMLRVLERQLMDLENGMAELHRASERSGEKEVALLGKLAGNLEKLMALEKLATGTKQKPQRNKQMEDLRNKLATRIEQLRRG